MNYNEIVYVLTDEQEAALCVVLMKKIDAHIQRSIWELETLPNIQ